MSLLDVSKNVCGYVVVLVVVGYSWCVVIFFMNVVILKCVYIVIVLVLRKDYLYLNDIITVTLFTFYNF